MNSNRPFRLILLVSLFYIGQLPFAPDLSHGKPIVWIDNTPTGTTDAIYRQTFGGKSFKSFHLITYTRSFALVVFITFIVLSMRRRSHHSTSSDLPPKHRHKSKPRIAIDPPFQFQPPLATLTGRHKQSAVEPLDEANPINAASNVHSSQARALQFKSSHPDATDQS